MPYVLVYSLTYWQPVQGFCREFVTWKVLHHPNVLPLLGVIMTEGRFLMVSEWMANGNINQFVTAHRDANRFALVSSPFVSPSSSPVIENCVGSRSWVMS